MKLGVIADDFTGASDIALTLSEGGMRVTQFIGVPTAPADPALEAGVVALKSRTAPKTEAVKDSLAACEWLLSQGAEQIVLKVCSTFDSTPEGNIGPVLEALAERLSENIVLVCPAFPENGRSVYQGHLFVGDALLNESGMQHHPLTPMTDPDLRRLLAAQTAWRVGHIPLAAVSSGSSGIRKMFNDDQRMLIVDAVKDDDLVSLGAAAHDRRLMCGGSGIAIGLPSNFGIAPGTQTWETIYGAGVILSGSCSKATRGQVAEYQAHNSSIEVTCGDVIDGVVSAERIAEWVHAQDGTPLVYSSADPEVVKAAQAAFGAEVAAEAIEQFFGKLARVLVERGTKRIVVAGGETSGAVTSALGASALAIGPRIAPGVPVMRLSDRPVALALKSGNFGDRSFFEKALAVMKGAA